MRQVDSRKSSAEDINLADAMGHLDKRLASWGVDTFDSDWDYPGINRAAHSILEILKGKRGELCKVADIETDLAASNFSEILNKVISPERDHVLHLVRHCLGLSEKAA